MKNKIISGVIGAVIVAVAYLGFVFYHQIRAVQSNTAQIKEVVVWVCQVDPKACGQEPAPATTTPTK